MALPAPKRLVVAGAGITGCLTALFAAWRGYDVTLLESRDKILDGASLIASRLHLGGEYCKDLPTGLDCLKAAMIWKMIMPDNIYTHEDPMRFVIPTGANALTAEEFGGYYEWLRQEYDRLLDEFGTMRGWDRKTAEKNFFGPADQGKFIRLLKDKELEVYSGGATGGYQSQEPGLDIPLYLGYLEQELQKQVEAGRLTIRTGVAVDSVASRPVRKGSAELKHAVHMADQSVLQADKLVVAAAEGAFAIKGVPYRSYPKILLRLMSVIDTRIVNRLGIKMPDTFSMSPQGGKNAMMLGNATKNISYGFLPGEDNSYDGEKQLSKEDPHVPTKWLGAIRLQGPSNYKARLKRFHEKMTMTGVSIVDEQGHTIETGLFSFLRKGKFGAFIQRIALTYDDALEKRRYQEPEELKSNLFHLSTTKLGFGLVEAITVMEMIADTHRAPLEAAMSGEYTLPKRLLDADDELNGGMFAYARGLPIAATSSYSRDPQASYRPDPASKINLASAAKPSVEHSRSFGLGFGLATIPAYVEGGQRTGPLLDDASRAALTRWLKDPRAIALPRNSRLFASADFGWAMHNRLMHQDQLTRHDLISTIFPHLKSSTRTLLFSEENLARLPLALRQNIARARPSAGAFADKDIWNVAFYFNQLNESYPHLTSPIEVSAETNARNYAITPRPLPHPDKDRIAADMAKAQPLTIIEPQENLPLEEAVLWNRQIPPSTQSATPIVPFSATIAAEIVSIIFPMLIAGLNDADRKHVMLDMLAAMHRTHTDRTFLTPLANPDINRLVVRDDVSQGGERLWVKRIDDNKRAIEFELNGPGDLSWESRPSGLNIEFQGETFFPMQIHIHRVKDTDGRFIRTNRNKRENKREFEIYTNHDTHVAIDRGYVRNPNHDGQLEIHGIFMKKDITTGYRRALAICTHVTLDPQDRDHAEVGRYLDYLQKALDGHEIGNTVIRPDQLPLDPLAFDPMAMFFPHGIDTHQLDDLPECPFMSATLGSIERLPGGTVDLKKGSSDIFYQGVHAIHLPTPLTISKSQLAQLQHLQERLITLTPQTCVNPIPMAENAWQRPARVQKRSVAS